MVIPERRNRETPEIDMDSSLNLLAVNRCQVRISSCAPAPEEVEVHREEIYNRTHSGDPVPSRQTLKSPVFEPQCGNVIFIDHQKGFGFISTPGQENGLFFRAADIAEGSLADLTEGARVEFCIGIKHQAPVATNIVLL